MSLVSNTAIIHENAQLGDNVTVHPYAIINDNTKIGDGSIIGPHTVIESGTTMGRNCRIGASAVIGGDPQDLKYKGEKTFVVIGDNTTIREFATVNRGTSEGETTIVGSNCLVMAYCHIAHNCVLEDRVIMSSFAGLAGHIYVEENAIIGGLVGVHQFVRIGRNSIIGGSSAVRQDVLPYTQTGGNPCKSHGLNIIGLKRHNYSPERISQLKKAYRIIFRNRLTEVEALKRLSEEMPDIPEVQHMIVFMERSQRGLARC